MIINEWTGTNIAADIPARIVDFTVMQFPNLPQQTRFGIYRAIVELITNVGCHAYPEEISKKGGWKIALSKDASGVATFTVSDQGITIPKSILNRLQAKSSALVDPKLGDARLIEDAVNQKSEVNLSHRGKGLSSIVELIDRSIFISMLIRSRHGIFHYSCRDHQPRLLDSDEMQSGTSIELSLSLEGTSQ